MIITERGVRKLRETDWVCTDPLCGNVNYSWRKVCNKCRKSRDEFVPPLVKVIGKNAAEKSGGIFMSEDWQCKKCGNVNWARGQYCYRCETSKFDPLNMISPEELMDNDDNVSVHSSLSSLNSPPVDADSGISSCEEMSDGKLQSETLAKTMLVFQKVVTVLTDVTEKEILEENFTIDKEIAQNVFFAAFCSLFLKGQKLLETDELANMTEEERLRTIASRSDLPEDLKKYFEEMDIVDLKQCLTKGMRECLSELSSNKKKKSTTESPLCSSFLSTPSAEISVAHENDVIERVTCCASNNKSPIPSNPIRCDRPPIPSKPCDCDKPHISNKQQDCDGSCIPNMQHACGKSYMSCKQHDCGLTHIPSMQHKCGVSFNSNKQHMCERTQILSKQHECDGSCIPSRKHECDRLNEVTCKQSVCDRPQVFTEMRRVVIVNDHRSTRSRSLSPQEERKIVFRPSRYQSSPVRRNYAPSSRPPHYRSDSRRPEARERTRDYRDYPYRRYTREPSRR